jgi:predicted SnoaL-like aldol condensation-catalyzing enzyme
MRRILALSILALFALITMCSDGDQATSDTNNSNDTEKNKAVVIRMHDELLKGNLDILDEVLAENYTRYCQSAPRPLWRMHGIDRMKVYYEGFLKAVPDMTEKIHEILAEGDKVAYRTTIKYS